MKVELFNTDVNMGPKDQEEIMVTAEIDESDRSYEIKEIHIFIPGVDTWVDLNNIVSEATQLSAFSYAEKICKHYVNGLE